MSAFVEANFADAALAFFDEAAMAAGVTLQGAARQVFCKLSRAFDGHFVQDVSKRVCRRTHWHSREIILHWTPELFSSRVQVINKFMLESPGGKANEPGY
jgi:hypothetical protein